MSHFWPRWSPDGRKLAFTSERDGNWEIYVMNADGSGQRNLTRTTALDVGAAWSPDGRRVVFVSKRGGKWAIYSMNADEHQVLLGPLNSALAYRPDCGGSSRTCGTPPVNRRSRPG